VSSGAYAMNDYNFKQPKLDLRADQKQEKQHAGSKFEVFEFPGAFRDKEEGKKLAKIRIEEMQSGHETINASCTARGLACGYLFELQKADRKDQEREYLITSTLITIQSDAFSPGGGGGTGDKFTCELTALPKTSVFRPARVTPKPVMRGPQTALVTGPPGEEIHCDEHGRVKVHFYWDRYSKANESSSKWVRVSNPSAGGGYGFMSIPRVGQEVLVEYIDGDPDRPVITGRLYNEDNKPPYSLPGEKNRSIWKTNTTKGGGGFNEIRMDDSKGREQIFIHSQRDMDIRVTKTWRAFIGTDSHTVVGQDASTATGRDEHHDIGRHEMTNVGTNRHTSIGSNDTTSVGSDSQLAAGMNVRVEAGMNLHTKAGLNHATEAGMCIAMEAGLSISLSAGGSFITIGPEGVTIQGVMVKINSGGAKGSLSKVSKKNPEKPKKAKESGKSSAGKVEAAKGMGHAKQPQTWKQKTVHDIAHAIGQAFVSVGKSTTQASNSSKR
jgi:type VI secretion system secreted protein VgrG